MSLRRATTLVFLLATTLAACSSSSSDGDVGAGGGGSGGSTGTKTDDEYKAELVAGMHDSLLADIETLRVAAVALKAAAPSTPGRGWDATMDAAAIAASKAAWIQARTAYENIEGATAPIFPDIDYTIDARYDDFMAELTPNGDAYLFDDTGATGLHMVERILWSDVTPADVVTGEAALPGYKASAFPATEAESNDYRDKLCDKIIKDAVNLKAQWTPANIDAPASFQGLVSLMNEQREKVNKAAAGAEESRYSQRTMADLRDNLAGTTKIYALFQPWLLSKPSGDPTMDGKTIDGKITAGFAKLNGVYGAISGDAFPKPPATWSAEHPSAADLMTPFGQLFAGVRGAVDPTTDGTVVSEMNQAAAVLGFPQFKQQ